MPLQIKTTGLEQYAPGGEARVKVMVIGGPGVGKTRWSSYFPKPIYADIEGGLASVADREVPYATVNTSQDMLDLLQFLKLESRMPWAKRQYQTVVIDTLDAFQRKIKNEWMEKENKQVFSGWDAWGYLNAKMGLLMTRLLNLDMNVIVAVHYKDKLIKDDETGRESREIALQLQGETSDTAFNDFDLVGWMGSYFEAVDGQKVEKRGLTFKRTSEKPFLKDRLYVTPPWMEVKFEDSDYSNLFSRITERIATLKNGQVVGEIPNADGINEMPAAQPISPSAAGAGAVAPQPEANAKLTDFDKPTLQTMAKERGLEFRGNTLKGELIALIEAHDSQPKIDPPSAAAHVPAAEPDPEPDEVTKAAAPADAPSPAPDPQQPALTVESVKAEVDADRAGTEQTEAGQVDTATGEIKEEPTHEEAVNTVENTLGGQVIKDEQVVQAPAAPAADAPTGECDDCGKPLADQRKDIVKLSKIKFRAPKPNPVKVGLCEHCYGARKAAA